MYKGSNRNMQRAGIKTAAGTAFGPSGQEPLPATNDQAKISEATKLARVRRSFELKQEITRRLARGESVAGLRADLDDVISGRVDLPLSLANDPKPSRDHLTVTVARKEGPERGDVISPVC